MVNYWNAVEPNHNKISHTGLNLHSSLLPYYRESIHFWVTIFYSLALLLHVKLILSKGYRNSNFSLLCLLSWGKRSIATYGHIETLVCVKREEEEKKLTFVWGIDPDYDFSSWKLARNFNEISMVQMCGMLQTHPHECECECAMMYVMRAHFGSVKQ